MLFQNLAFILHKTSKTLIFFGFLEKKADFFGFFEKKADFFSSFFFKADYFIVAAFE